MDILIGLFYFPVLRPFYHWLVITLSYHIAKLFIKEEFLEKRYYLSTWDRIFIYIFICVPAFVIACIAGLLLHHDPLYLKIILEVMIPVLVSCFFNIQEQPLPVKKPKTDVYENMG